ncbi:50S ribosomal protein L6 [Candidatus Methanosphaera massiliense]|jgi:large subunit ribosomal protein L6|uniref:50S ribosomal protein L6 n=1 Tax=Methanosphaera TaxID=2316 RepID=UPI000DC2F0FA|nr:50S ribosomal protein L6 [Candidatus Methanosphaera massiliense]MDD6285204.1 50S ribosomal protein L6 [Methanobacteriaceae archaeon]MDE4078477.1 50S ribosomal protein L6 [Candidatus Methanosphaera massiliense]MDY2744916.1 50S ribosomal protein L6 [Methanosphaera sp.]RAP45529.1 MAG: 50S ribosomal protein L6 [Methanosphaera sp. SHI1033]
MVKLANITETIPIPEDVTVNVENSEVTVKGNGGEIKRNFNHNNITISNDDENVTISVAFPNKKDKAMVGTIKSHVSNMIYGVKHGFTYKMKIVYAHFPMTVKVKGNIVSIDNFLGERSPRTAKIIGDVKVSVKGDDVTITGINKEHVGQTMANIEQATKIKGRDPRIFQDGIYLVDKTQEELEE